MRPHHFLLVGSALFTVGCASLSTGTSSPAATVLVPVHADTAGLHVEAQRILQAFASGVQQARGSELAAAPTVVIRNQPQLIGFVGSVNQVFVPWWDTSPPEMRSVFQTFAGGGEAEAAHFFRAFFNRFLLAHEAGHWFQARAKREERTLYDNENAANRLAVAFWRTQPGGEALLAELESLAARAADRLPDPTPAGQDAVAYFGANYEDLARDPLKYGYYQFRFMRDAIRDRKQLDFAQMVRVEAR
ncbi:MAG: hypothetical protein V4813_16500 [Gemmatimonadota bacterium]